MKSISLSISTDRSGGMITAPVSAEQERIGAAGELLDPEGIDGAVQLVGLGELLPREPGDCTGYEYLRGAALNAPGPVRVQLRLLESGHGVKPALEASPSTLARLRQT